MGAAQITKTYNLETIGGAKVVADINAVAEAFERVKKIKIELNNLKDKTTDPGTIRKVTEELDRQTKAQNNNVVKMNTAVSTGLKLASVNKELRLEIKNVVEEVQKRTSVVNFENLALVAEIQNVQKLTEEGRKYTKQTKETTKATADNTKATTDNTKEELRKKIAQQQSTQQLKNQIREEENLKGSLEQRRAALIRLNSVYDRLSPKERDSAWGLRLQKTIQGLDLQVKALEGTTGRAQRNVGNYASGWGSVAQAGGRAFGVLKQIANFLPGLGMSGIVGLGVSGILVLADAMHILETMTEKEIEQIKMFGEEQKKMISTIASEKTNLDVLYQTATNVNVSYRERGKAVDELIKQYPDYFTNVNREKLLNGQLQSTYEALTKSIYQRAEAQAKQNLLNKLVEERVALELRLQKLTQANAKGEFYYSQENADAIRAQILAKDDQIKQLEDAMQIKKEDFANDVYYIDQKTKKQVEAQQKKDKYYAEHGDTTKEDKKRAAQEKKRQDELKKLADDAKKAEEERLKIIHDAKLNLLDDQSKELYARAERYLEDEKKLVNASAEDKKALEESYNKDIQAIIEKYTLKYWKEIAERETEAMRIMAEAHKKEQEQKKSNLDKLAKLDKDEADQERARQAQLISDKEEADKAANRRAENNKRAAFENSLSLAQQFADSQARIAQQEVDSRYDATQAIINADKEKALAQAQSAAERQAIEQEFDRKQIENQRQKNIEQQKIAKKQATVAFGLASIRAIAAGLETGGIPGAIIAEALVLGEYLLALNNINSQKFEEGGQVPTSTGGPITGPSHAAGGVPFGFEAEGGEMAIINKNSTMDKGTYNLTGTPRQIASAINELGGGVRFAPGAVTRKFEYGGMLGSNLSAPVFRSYIQSSTGGAQSEFGMEALRAISSMNSRMDSLQVILDPHAVTKFQNNHIKQTQVGTI